jgi:Leucine-rich repeat (LRR) protein
MTVVISAASNTQQLFINGLPVPTDANGNVGALSFDATSGQFAYPRSARYAAFVGKQAVTTRAGYALTGGEIFTYSGSFSYFGVFDTPVETSGDNSELRRLVSGSCCGIARHGITCTGPDVTDINLSSNGVIGTLPSTFFTYFKFLKSFDISSQCSQAAQCQNMVASVFSSDMYLPPTLTTLVLSNNNIQGALPADILRGASPALTTLEVTGNGLSGTLF